MTHAVSDVEAPVVRLAERETVDPLWTELLNGTRLTRAGAAQRFAGTLSEWDIRISDLPFKMARKPRAGWEKGESCFLTFRGS